jgi:anti-sigma factor RsiW
MISVAPDVVAVALTVCAILFRRESCQQRRRHWRQVIAISALLLLGAIARALASGTRADCDFNMTPFVHTQNR